MRPRYCAKAVLKGFCSSGEVVTAYVTRMAPMVCGKRFGSVYVDGVMEVSQA